MPFCTGYVPLVHRSVTVSRKIPGLSHHNKRGWNYTTLSDHLFSFLLCETPETQTATNATSWISHSIVCNLKMNWKKKVFFSFLESKANSRTVCRSFPFDFRFLIRLFSATIVRRNKDAPNAIRVPCNGTHEDVSTPCRIRQEINNIYSGGEYGMMPIYWCCCPHAVKAHEAIPAERSKPNGTKRKKKIVDINSNLWENFIDCYVVVFIFMPFDSMRFPHSAAPVAIYCNSIFSPFPSPAFCESRNTFFVFYRLNSAPLVRHSIRETDTRAKYFFFSVYQATGRMYEARHRLDLIRVVVWPGRKLLNWNRENERAQNGSHTHSFLFYVVVGDARRPREN